MSEKGYDRKCEQLAWHFLGARATPARVEALAAHIQCQIELWVCHDHWTHGREYDPARDPCNFPENIR